MKQIRHCFSLEVFDLFCDQSDEYHDFIIQYIMLNISCLRLVPMTKTKTILGISLAAIFAAMIIPVMADGPEPITPLKKTHLSISDDKFNKVLFRATGNVNTGSVFGGYAIITGGDVIAVTSHPGFYDSDVQDEPTEDPAINDPFTGVAQVCTATDSGCGHEWHTHLVKGVEDNRCALGVAVGDLSFKEPNHKTKQVLKWISLNGIPFGDQTLESATTGDDTTFTVGLPADAPFINGFQYSAAFDLTPLTDETGLTGICIGPAA